MKRTKTQMYYFRESGEPFDWKIQLLNAEFEDDDRNKRPDMSMVNSYIDKWHVYDKDEDALNEVFKQFNDSNNEQHVFIRLLVLNEIYSTRLDVGKVRDLANMIVKHTSVYVLDNYDPTIVNNIREDFRKEHNYDPYSITSKYFSHVNDKEYPLYDSCVKSMLLWYRYKNNDFNFSVGDLDSYDRFKIIIKEFIRTFNLECDLKTVDKYLWVAGKELFPQYVYKDIVDSYRI